MMEIKLVFGKYNIKKQQQQQQRVEFNLKTI